MLINQSTEMLETNSLPTSLVVWAYYYT